MYESPHRIVKTLVDLLAHLGDRQVALVREITKKFEEVFRGKLSEAMTIVGRKTPRGEYVVVLAGKDFHADADPGKESASHSITGNS